jgi:hypothetical protein
MPSLPSRWTSGESFPVAQGSFVFVKSSMLTALLNIEHRLMIFEVDFEAICEKPTTAGVVVDAFRFSPKNQN